MNEDNKTEYDIMSEYLKKQPYYDDYIKQKLKFIKDSGHNEQLYSLVLGDFYDN